MAGPYMLFGPNSKVNNGFHDFKRLDYTWYSIGSTATFFIPVLRDSFSLIITSRIESASHALIPEVNMGVSLVSIRHLVVTSSTDYTSFVASPLGFIDRVLSYGQTQHLPVAESARAVSVLAPSR
jgi:hypothetical protein